MKNRLLLGIFFLLCLVPCGCDGDDTTNDSADGDMDGIEDGDADPEPAENADTERTDGDADMDSTEDEHAESDAIEDGDAEEDPYGRLIWQDPAPSETLDWYDAVAYCEDLDLDGSTDWRLPSIGELRSLIRGCSHAVIGGPCGVDDSCLSSECYDNDVCRLCMLNQGPGDGSYWPEGMSATEGAWTFWSSSPLTDGEYDEYVWRVDFDRGHIYWEYVWDPYSLRCVRDGR